MTISFLKEQILKLLQIFILLFFLSAFYDSPALILIGIVLLFIDLFLNYRQYILIIFNFYFLLFPTGLYLAVGYSRPTNLYLAAGFLVLLYAASYFFINHIKSFRLLILTLAGGLLFYLRQISLSDAMQFFFKVSILFWAYNFFLLMKESDQPQKKSVLHTLTSMNAFWNYPAFLNSTYSYLTEYQLDSKSELQQNRKDAIIMLLKSTPLFIFNNYLGYILMNKTFVISDFQNHVFRLYYTTPAYDTLVNMGIFTTPAFNYIFGILGGGMIYISFLIYANVVTVGFLAFLGYNLPFKGIEITKINSFSGYIHQIFYFYNHTLIHVFYPRIHSLLKKSSKTQFYHFFKKIKIYPTVIIGGFYINLMTDYVVISDYYSASQILINTFLLIPYFFILSSVVHISHTAEPSVRKLWFVHLKNLILYSITLSIIFSFGRLLFTKKSLSGFIDIYLEIFSYFYQLFVRSF